MKSDPEMDALERIGSMGRQARLAKSGERRGARHRLLIELGACEAEPDADDPMEQAEDEDEARR